MRRRTISYISTIMVVALLSTIIVGCKREGPAERAGERVDEAVDKAAEGENPIKKEGPGEELGEELDRALSTSTPTPQ